jgi:hypothetical protein
LVREKVVLGRLGRIGKEREADWESRRI